MVFKREWDSLYSATARGRWKDTPQNGKDFLSLESRRSRTRNANLQAKIQNGNTKEWDSSTLFFALLDSVSIGTTLKPLVRKDVYDLRCIRNELVHLSKAELTDVEFQNIVSKVSAAFSSLALPLVYVIEGVRNQTTFKTDEVDEPRREVDALKQIYQERVPEAFAVSMTSDSFGHQSKSVKLSCLRLFKELNPNHLLTTLPENPDMTTKKQNLTIYYISTLFPCDSLKVIIIFCSKTGLSREEG